MKRNFLVINSVVFLLFFTALSFAQTTVIQGSIRDAMTGNPIMATVAIEETSIVTQSTTSGQFYVEADMLPTGDQILRISAPNYISKRYPVEIIQGQILNLPYIELDYDLNQEQLEISTISLSDTEIENGEENESYGIPGLLQASKDVFLRAAAYDFSSTFFRPRGFGSENGKVLINGMEMNSLNNGRPQWSQWGGLNDVQRNQEFSVGLTANDYSFGGVSGLTNIVMRASTYRKGGRISYASSNRSYQGRVMATYNSGLGTNGWAFSVSASRRYGNQGYIDGTLYDANSIFASVEKKINSRHSINLTSFYTPNSRGRSTAITDEVYQLKGNQYNPYWGFYLGEKKNSRTRTIEQPVILLNHYWNLSPETLINTNIGLQTGKRANSRINSNGTDRLFFNGEETYVGGGRSSFTNPIHPTQLPSFYVQEQNPSPLDFQNAYLAQKQFIENGQLNWNKLIEANQIQAKQGRNTIYALSEDVEETTQYSFNTILDTHFSDILQANASVSYRNLKIENYAEISDLLGGNGFLDIDPFALNDTQFSPEVLLQNAQNDLQHPNRIVTEGDRYQYNYTMNASVANTFLQGQLHLKKIDFFVSGTTTQTSYQREGLFENGYFLGAASFGKSEKIQFSDYGVKAGTTLKLSGRYTLNFNGAYFTKAPTIRNSFANARKNNALMPNVSNEKISSADVGYIFRSPKLKGRITGYYTEIKDAAETGFFFTETIALENSENTAEFVQENLTGIHKRHFGGELGIEYQLTPVFKIKAAAASGQFTYTNDPELTLSTDRGIVSLGSATLKNYKLANGPQQAAQIGFEYRDPNFWWLGATTNYFSNAYVDVSAFKRTNNFNIDPENGLAFNDYNPDVAKELLTQEQLNDYFLVNVVGGKSWRIKNYYIGFFAAINNVLNQEYKTGGFEQARRANYRTSLEEASRDTPIFGNRYFFGTGTTYYINFYIRF